jgi:ribosomal protein S27E
MEGKLDIIEEASRKRAKRFYYDNPQIKTVKLLNKNTKEQIKCPECDNISFKFYQKIGGVILSSYRNKVMKNNPIKHTYICKCGIRLILPESEFEFVKIKYGCSAKKCPYGKTKMEKDCLSCKYIYEK